MNNNHDRSDFIDIEGLLRQYLSKWYWFVISVAACLGLAVAYIIIHKPSYQINANILIADNEDGGGGMAGELGAFSGLFGGKNSVDDEALILGSHSVMKATAKVLGSNVQHIERTGLFGLIKTNIYDDVPIDVIPANASIPDTLRTALRFRVHVDKDGRVDVVVKARRKVYEFEDKTFPVAVTTPYGDFTVVSTPFFPKGESMWMDINYVGYDKAAEGMSEFIMVDIVTKKANMIYLGYKTPYPDYGMKLLDELMAQYNKRGITEDNIKGQKTIKFVDERLNMLGVELDDLQDAYADFLNKHGVASIWGDINYSYQLKGTYESHIVEAESKVEILKMMREFLRNPENAYSLIPGNLNSEADQTVSRYNELLLKRLELERTASDDNRSMVLLNERIDAMRDVILKTLDRSYESALLALNEVQSRLNRTAEDLSTAPFIDRDGQKMLRERATKELVFKYLLQQREESAMKIANAISKGVVVDEAYVQSEPLGMSNKMILALALVMGLLFPPVFIYFYTLLRGRFDTKEEVEKYTPVPVLGEVCVSRSGETLVVKPDNITSSEAELFRLIRTNLQFMLRDSDDKVVLVTSTQSGEGKSFVSINLASSLSLLGKRTLLVGMDIRAGMLDRYLNLPPSRGLTEYLASTSVSLNDIIIREPFERDLDIIVAGPVPPNPSELLSGGRVDELFAQLRERYDYIVVDSAPVGMVSDTFALARISDATIYVCRANYTPLRDLKFVNNIYDQQRLKRMGLVVNGTKTRKGYGYGYGRGHDHKKR